MARTVSWKALFCSSEAKIAPLPPGAGGGGYLYMMAKDPEAAARIRQVLGANRMNANARFVDMTLSKAGLQVSRS